MKRKLVIALMISLVLVLTLAISVSADPPDKLDCTSIPEGIITYSTGHFLEGQPLMVGYDPFGYNYQAHMFSGSYANAYLGGGGFPPYTGDDASYLAANPAAASTWYWPYRHIQLLMKWDQEWLANVDCNGDGALDRHFGFDTYIGSGAWLTNHMFGSYDLNGTFCEWDYFTKIVAAPDDATLVSGVWFNADGVEIGPVIWGEFATIQEVENDPCAGIEGIQYLSPDHAGFGGW